MPIEVVGNQRVHYQWLCKPKADRPLKVVCLHGLLLGNLASWYLPSLSVKDALDQIAYVLFYDLRGHGKSQWSANGYDDLTLIHDLDQLLHTLGWDKEQLVLVGHSYGGWVALRFAQLHPHRVAALGLVDTPFPPFKTHPLSTFLDQLKEVEYSEMSLQDLKSHLPPLIRSAFQKGGRRAIKKLRAWYKLIFKSSMLDDLAQTPSLSDWTLPSSLKSMWTVYGTQSPCQSDETLFYSQLKMGLPHLFTPQSTFCLERHTLDSGHFILDECADSLMILWVKWLQKLVHLS